MPTYLYCLVPPAAVIEPRPAFPRGIAGSAVRVLCAGAVEAWVSTVDDRVPRPTVIAVREHDAVVTAALATGRTPLPARFGQTWPSDAECASSVVRRNTELALVLSRVAGMVEMTVCSPQPGPPPAARPPDHTPQEAGPGTAYLGRLRARVDRERDLRVSLDTLRDRLNRAIGSLSRGELAEIHGSEETLALSISYLVERSEEGAFRRAVNEVARETAAHLVVVGPRAPYSFSPTARQPERAHTDRALEAP
jgi:hypothetical protein